MTSGEDNRYNDRDYELINRGLLTLFALGLVAIAAAAVLKYNLTLFQAQALLLIIGPALGFGSRYIRVSPPVKQKRAEKVDITFAPAQINGDNVIDIRDAVLKRSQESTKV